MRESMSILFVIVGFILVLAGVSSDCNGQCMEDAMSFPELFMTVVAGIGFITLGIMLSRK